MKRRYDGASAVEANRGKKETDHRHDHDIREGKSPDKILNIQSGDFGCRTVFAEKSDGIAHYSQNSILTTVDDTVKLGNENEKTKIADDMEEAMQPIEVQLSECTFMFPKKKVSEHGNVYEGEIRSTIYDVRPCVIKFAEISSQNIQEAKILSKLGSHTNVITIITSGIYGDILEDRFYIVLDKCHSENLRHYLINRKQSGIEYDLHQANSFALQLIDGVSFIHDSKVVHLDLKPSNILLSLNQRLIRIADFGLSREIESSCSKFHVVGQFGTNGYRPIESFGDGWVSMRSDIFSLGAVLYHLLSNGEEVFGNDEHKYIYNVYNDVFDISRLLVLNPETTKHLIKLMLEKERCRRPTIWQVAEHPCWTGKEVECSFDYGYENEVCDGLNTDLKKDDPASDDSETEIERTQKLVKMLRRTRTIRPSGNSIIVFDRFSQHLQRFCPKKKSVTQMHKYTVEMKKNSFNKYSFTSVFLKDHVYVLTECKKMYRLKYSNLTASWERMADLTEEYIFYSRPPAVSARGDIVLAAETGGFIHSVTKYNPSLNSWETLSDKPLATRYSANVSLQKYVYCIGGLIRCETLNVEVTTDRVERLNVDLRSWEEVASMHEARFRASAARCGSSIIVAGGEDKENKFLRSVEKYDGTLNQWTTMKPMGAKRWGAGFRCHLINGRIYAVGPGGQGIEMYDVQKDEWKFILGAGDIKWWCDDSVTVEMK